MKNEKKKHQRPGIPTEELCPDDGKPHHDNPNHAGARSHQRRSIIDPEYEEYPIHARPQCAYVKSMKRD